VDRFGIHFIVLDSETPLWEGTYQRGWLDQDISKSTAAYIVVLLHRPVYGTGPHGAEDAKVLPAMLAPLFQRGRVSAVFSGHDHLYERSEVDGITYVVAGGGGAPLYKKRKAAAPYSKVFITKNNFVALSLKPEGLFAEAFGDDGALLDSFSAKPRRPRK
jgi:3',5'-cyclic AMP phosphodiesterase CpdA